MESKLERVAPHAPRSFRRFVAPYIREQCQKLDYSLYHLDGVEAIGPAGVHILMNFHSERDIEQAERIAERYR